MKTLVLTLTRLQCTFCVSSGLCFFNVSGIRSALKKNSTKQVTYFFHDMQFGLFYFVLLSLILKVRQLIVCFREDPCVVFLEKRFSHSFQRRPTQKRGDGLMSYLWNIQVKSFSKMRFPLHAHCWGFIWKICLLFPGDSICWYIG